MHHQPRAKTSPTLDRLRQRLYDCGKTQPEIAAATGVGQSTVGRIMRGEVDATTSVVDRLTAWLDDLDKATRRRAGRKRKPLELGAGAR